MSKSQERKLNSFHFRCLRRLLKITWKDKITNQEVLKRTGLTSIYSLLMQRRLGHVRRMDDGRIPKRSPIRRPGPRQTQRGSSETTFQGRDQAGHVRT